MRQLFLSFLILLCGLAATTQNIVVLKDGSSIKAEILEDTDEYVKFRIASGDTLSMGYKYVDNVIGIKDYKLRYPINSMMDTEKFHKTEGIFVNLDAFSFPISLAIGQRINSSLNFGGIISFGTDEFSNVLGIGPYVQNYFGSSIHKTRFYVEGYAGIGRRTNSFFNESLNEYPIFGGFSVGVQVPNKKKVKFYFELGTYAVYSERTAFLNDFNRTQILDSRVNFLPQATLLGIQF